MQVDDQAPRLHSPPPSAVAPKPKGILKNASGNGASQTEEDPQPQTQSSGNEMALDTQSLAPPSTAAGGAAVPPGGDDGGLISPGGGRLQWDETNLTLHEIERENTAARMKIDEPKTPFVRGSSLGPDDMGDESELSLSDFCTLTDDGALTNDIFPLVSV